MNGSEISPDAPPSSNPPPKIIGGSPDDPFATVPPGSRLFWLRSPHFGHNRERAGDRRRLERRGAWNTWTPVGLLPGIASGLGIASLDGNRFDVFARSVSRTLTHAWFESGAWGSSDSTGGTLDKDILGTWNRDSSNTPILHLLGVSQTFVLHKTGASDWSSGDVNGNVWSACAVISAANSSLDVFARGANGHLVHKSFFGGWVDGFLDLGLDIPDEPSVVITGARIHIFARNPNGSIWHAHLPR